MPDTPPAPTDPPPPRRHPDIDDALRRYWRANLTIMAVLLSVWAVVSLGCGVLFADVLNGYRLPGTGYPLGFWFAQQGSIMTFVLIILVYCVLLNRLDNKHHDEVARLERDAGGARP